MPGGVAGASAAGAPGPVRWERTLMPQDPARGGERGPAALPGVSLATQDYRWRKV
jgi:hypothetical protein